MTCTDAGKKRGGLLQHFWLGEIGRRSWSDGKGVELVVLLLWQKERKGGKSGRMDRFASLEAWFGNAAADDRWVGGCAVVIPPPPNQF
jgi:hypothetical protein